MSPDRAEIPSYKGLDDQQLVERCRVQRDEAAFAELLFRYRTPVFRLAASILGQAFVPEAEDVAQEVFVRIHHALGGFRGDSAFSTWIYRITFNHALNVKARVRYRAPHVGDEILARLASSSMPPDQRVQYESRRRALLECIGELPDVYQSALRLHYWLGTSIAEIAKLLDAPENTIKSYLHRARRLLQAKLAERGFHE